MKYKVTRLTNIENWRTSEVTGESDNPPRVGEQFIMIAKGLRLVTTSPIVKLTKNTFITKSGSKYRYELLA